MTRIKPFLALTVVVAIAGLSAPSASDDGNKYWPQWRGPLASGVARNEKTTWSTPLIVEHAGKNQVITAATSKVRSYDLADGKLLWEGPGLTPGCIASPVHSNGVVYVMSGFRGSALYAIRLAEAKGDITAAPQAIVWKYDRDTPGSLRRCSTATSSISSAATRAF